MINKIGYSFADCFWRIWLYGYKASLCRVH